MTGECSLGRVILPVSMSYEFCFFMACWAGMPYIIIILCLGEHQIEYTVLAHIGGAKKYKGPNPVHF